MGVTLDRPERAAYRQVSTLWALTDADAERASACAYDALGVGLSMREVFSYPFRFTGRPTSQAGVGVATATVGER